MGRPLRSFGQRDPLRRSTQAPCSAELDPGTKVPTGRDAVACASSASDGSRRSSAALDEARGEHDRPGRSAPLRESDEGGDGDGERDRRGDAFGEDGGGERGGEPVLAAPRNAANPPSPWSCWSRRSSCWPGTSRRPRARSIRARASGGPPQSFSTTKSQLASTCAVPPDHRMTPSPVGIAARSSNVTVCPGSIVAGIGGWPGTAATR